MSDVDTSGDERRRNKRWPEALKREIVAATFLPGASVSVVARQYDVDASQVFSWRRRYGESGKAPATPPPPSGLVPVLIAPDPERVVGATSTTPSTAEAIEIEVAGDCRVRVGAGFDARALKRVLDVLRKR